MPSPSPAPSPPVSPKQEYKAVKEEEEVLVKEEPVEKAMFEVKEEPCPMKVEVKSVDVSNEQEPGEIKDEAVEESEDVKNEERSRESSPVLDRAAQLLKMEVTGAIKAYQQYFIDLDLANKVSQPNMSSYNRQVLLQKMNASTVHIDGYYTRIEMARNAEQLQALLTEIQAQNRRAKQSLEMYRLLRI